MKHIKSYMTKINQMVDAKKPTKTVDSKGLLAPRPNSTQKKDDGKSVAGAEMVAAYVKAIREARKGIKNGK